jgi:serine/threonine protein kinase
MSQHVRYMDEYAVDLLQQMVALEPNNRISCRMALEHPYFDDLDKSKFVQL